MWTLEFGNFFTFSTQGLKKGTLENSLVMM